MAFLEQRAEGERFTRRPVDAFAGLDCLGAIVEKTLDGLVDLKAWWNDRDLRADLAQGLNRNAGVAAARIVGVARGFQARPAAVEPVGLVGLVTARCLEFSFKPCTPIGAHLFYFTFGDDVLGDQFLAVDFLRGRMRADFLIHQRLGERGLIAFVVAETPVAEHVDDHRPLELHAVFGRHFRREHHRFRIVAVHMEDQRLNHLGNV